MEFDRISVDHRVMGGVPCVRGTRIPVATIVGLLADSESSESILADYPQLSPADVEEALRYAAAVLRERVLPLQESA